MPKTYRITIEYTTLDKRPANGPDHWEWEKLLDLDYLRETFGVWVDEVKTNADHVREITEFAKRA
jgi:hypothetical protein